MIVAIISKQEEECKYGEGENEGVFVLQLGVVIGTVIVVAKIELNRSERTLKRVLEQG